MPDTGADKLWGTRTLVLVATAVAVATVLPILFGAKPYPEGLLAEFGPWELANDVRAAGPERDYIDILAQIYPDDVVARREWAAGRMPAWNPHIFMGTPLAAQGNIAFWAPFSWPGWVLRSEHAWAVHCALQIFVAALGMGLFLRGRNLAGAAAVFGAVAFALNGFIQCYLPFRSFTGPLVWLPLWMWALDTTRENTRRGPLWMLFAVSAAAFLSGNIQSTAYFVLICCAWLAFMRDRVRIATLSLAFGAVLGAVNWLPACEFYSYSGRAEGVAGGFYVDSNFLPPAGLIGLAVPSLVGRYSDLLNIGPSIFNRLYFSQLGGLGYAGLATFVLAIAGLVRWRSLISHHLFTPAVAAVAGPLVILLLLGTAPGQGIVRAIQPLADNDLLRLFFLTSFGIAILGALAFHHFFARSAETLPGDPPRPLWTRYAVPGLVLCAAVEMLCNAAWQLPWFTDTAPDAFNIAASEAPVPEILRTHDAERYRVAAQGEYLPANLPAVYGLADIRGYESLAPARTRLALATLDANYFPHARNTFPNLFLAAGYARPMALMGVNTFIRRYGAIEAHDAVPRVTFVPDWTVVDAPMALRRFIKLDFDPYAIAHVEHAPARNEQRPTTTSPIVDASGYHLSGGTIHVSSERAGVVRVTDVMVPGWKAFVRETGNPDVSRETRIYYTDFLFRGILLPPGEHTVTLRYEPWAFRVGLWTSLGALLAAIVLGAGRRRLFTATP